MQHGGGGQHLYTYDLAAQALLGPIFYRRLMTSEPLDPHRVGDLIDMVLGP